MLGFVGTDENGLDGIEYAFDDMLRGRSGRVTLEADEFGRPIPFGRERVVTPAQPGSDVELTIDPYLQFVAERALAKQVAAYHALDGTAIVMDPWSGEVLAMANVPELRSESLLEVRRRTAPRPRGHGRVRARLDLQAGHGGGGARVA